MLPKSLSKTLQFFFLLGMIGLALLVLRSHLMGWAAAVAFLALVAVVNVAWIKLRLSDYFFGER